MALLVTFGKKDGPLESLGDCESYSLDIGADADSMTVPDGRNVVTLLPSADCWIAAGKNELGDAARPPTRRPLVAEVARRFSCRPGQTLSVIQRV